MVPAPNVGSRLASGHHGPLSPGSGTSERKVGARDLRKKRTLPGPVPGWLLNWLPFEAVHIGKGVSVKSSGYKMNTLTQRPRETYR